NLGGGVWQFTAAQLAGLSLTVDDGPATLDLLVTARSQEDTGEVAQTAAHLTVDVGNVAPTAGVTGPSSGSLGQSISFTLHATDPSAADQAAGFTFAIDWGDGATQTVDGPDGLQVEHVYQAGGTYTVQVSATDRDGATSAPATSSVAIGSVVMVGNDLVVSGTPNGDDIVIKPADRGAGVRVIMNGVDLGTFSPVGRVVVYGLGGDDIIRVVPGSRDCKTTLVGTPAVLDGGDGNDVLNVAGSKVGNILIGGAGDDVLIAGQNCDVLIGGLGADILNAGNEDDLLIAGNT